MPKWLKDYSIYLIQAMNKDNQYTLVSTGRIIVFCVAFYFSPYINAQIPHGGKPLEVGAERSSSLRSEVDYFVNMPSFDVDSALEVDDLPGNRVGGLTFAHKFFVNLTPENSGITFHTEDGTKVWKVGIRSTNAYSLNILFSEFTLPEGAKVFLYNSDRSAILGAFTNENRPNGGELSVSPVDGDELTIEYQEPADAAFSGKICISEVNHDFRGLFRAGTRFNLINLPCLPDVSCDSKYDTIEHSVCLLIIDGTTYCSGTLLNNTAKDGKPYLLTASHCLNNNASLGSRVVVFLNYTSPRCDKRIRGSEEFSVSGSITRALSNEVDFALLELTEIPPSDYRPYLAGWSRDTVPATGLPYTGIHHPYGEVMKYCVDTDSLTAANWTETGYGIASGNHWNVRHWNIGHTWGGSSGSGLFDKNLRFRGSLTGGDSGGISGCDTIYNEGDYYARFDRGWNQFSSASKQLKHWLDPLTPDNAQSPVTLEGLDPYANNPSKRINNLQISDSLGNISLQKPSFGSIFGHNSLKTSYYAEHFTTTHPSMIFGTYLIAIKGTNNSSLPITVRVYKGGNEPGAALGKTILNPNYIDYSNGSFETVTKSYFSNRENYVRFDSPISVDTDFYVGYQIAYPLTSVSDSFYLYAAINREKDAKNTAFFKEGNNWLPYTVHPSGTVSTSLWIEPVIAGDTITTPNTFYENDTDSTILNKPVLAYSNELLYIALPDRWASNTKVEIFNLLGQKLLESTISPPIGIISLPKRFGRIFIVRLKSERLVFIQKI
jgi:lysyl endopeptidase